MREVVRSFLLSLDCQVAIGEGTAVLLMSGYSDELLDAQDDGQRLRPLLHKASSRLA